MLTRLQIQGFKCFADVDVELAPLVILFGPNAVGKSNFLEALLLLSRMVGERTVGDALAAFLRGYPIEAFRLPELGLQEILAQEEARLSLAADVRVGNSRGKSPDLLRYRVGVRIRPKTGAVEVVDEYLARLKKDGTEKFKPRIEKDADYLIIRRLGESGQPRREELGLNHTVASNRQFSGEKRYPDFDRLREELSSWRTFYLDPRVAMRKPSPPMEVQDIGPRGEGLAPFLHRLKESPRHHASFQAIRRALHSAIPAIEDLDVDLDPQRGTLDITARAERQVIVTTHSPHLIAAMARRQQSEELKNRISLMRCISDGATSRIIPFDPMPLFRDHEIASGLASPDDGVILEEALLRGWLDG